MTTSPWKVLYTFDDSGPEGLDCSYRHRVIKVTDRFVYVRDAHDGIKEWKTVRLSRESLETEREAYSRSSRDIFYVGREGRPDGPKAWEAYRPDRQQEGKLSTFRREARVKSGSWRETTWSADLKREQERLRAPLKQINEAWVAEAHRLTGIFDTQQSGDKGNEQ